MKKTLYRLFNGAKITLYCNVATTAISYILEHGGDANTLILLKLLNVPEDKANSIKMQLNQALPYIQVAATKEGRIKLCIDLAADLFWQLTDGKYGTELECKEFIKKAWDKVK